LVRVRLYFPDLRSMALAFLYVAHWSPLRSNPHMHEFVADRFIEGLRSDTPVIMECDRAAVELRPVSRGDSSMLAKTIVIQ